MIIWANQNKYSVSHAAGIAATSFFAVRYPKMNICTEIQQKRYSGKPDPVGDKFLLEVSFLNSTGAAQNKTAKKHHAVTRHFDPEFRNSPETPLTENEIYTITLIDGLGKPVQVKKSTSIKTAVTQHSVDITKTVIARDTRKWLVNGKVETDAFGRAVKTWYPILEDYNVSNPFNTAALSYNATAYETGENFYTEATYDVLDRVKTTKLPGETAEMLTSYSIEAGLFKTTVVNELNQTKHSFTDVRGRTTKVVEDSNDAGTITTEFTYNALSELIKVEDTDGNITESFYDMAGRRTELRHPDNGITKFTYDKASNLIAKETANLLAENHQEKIEYFYTFNRLDSIVYPRNPYNNVHFFYGEAQDASAADDFSVGRLWYQIDATGVQQFKYGRLGEVRYNLRSVAVPGDKAYWFKTEWEYDTWNRVKKIIYPDEEEVSYFYNRGGELHAITSKKQEQQNEDIISQLGYDKFGQRTYLRYGNGTETYYKYETDRRRLQNMTAKSNTTYGSSVNRTFINNNYSYDILSNVLSVENTAALPTTGQIGGSVLYEYEYDDLNRLKTATGNFTGRNMADTGHEYQKYMLAMEYDNMHNILGKTQVHETSPDETEWTKAYKTTYDLTYQEYNTAEFNVAGYSYTQPHAVRQITDKPETTSTGNDVKTKLYDYDANGNMTQITQKTGESETIEKLRTNLWDEENRLRAVDITPDAEGVRPIAIYTYDAGGERILKHSNTSVSIYLNGKKVADTIQTNATLYPSGMLVARLGNNGNEEEQTLAYTKHYYAGTQRVFSKIGTTENLGDYLQDWVTQGTGGPVDVVGSSFGVLENAEDGVVQVYTELGIDPPTYDSSPVFIPVQSFVHGDNENEIYWFHPDHLGSTSYISNLLGEVSQHMEYFAFGETFVEEHRSSNNSPYKYNGKELDEETGLYYYGARYYNPRTSVFISVDPLTEQTMTPYQYTYQNPVRYIDPTGMAPEHIDPTAIYFSDYKGKLNTPHLVESWEFFASSKIGINFLKDFAKAGQTIAGHTYEKDGKYHKKGINLILGTGACTIEYNERRLYQANGLTDSVIKLNGMDIIIDIEDYKTINNLSTFLHEFFVHGIPSAEDYYDNKKLDFSAGYEQWFMDFVNKNWSEKNKTNKRLIEHKLEKSEHNKNKRLEKYGAPIMQEFYKKKGIKKDTKTIKNEIINLWIKNSFLLCLILLFILGCNNKKINIYENTEDSFPKLLIAINDSLFDNLNENGIRYQNYKDTVHFKDFLYPEKTIVFQKVNFEDFGFRSNKILISFERAEETNGINFSAEISNYDSLYIKYYDFKNRKNVLEINLNKEEKKMFKTLLSNLNHYNQEYKKETYSPFSDEKLLVVFDINNTNEIISGNLKLMPKQLSALVIMIEVYIKRFSKESDNTTMKDLPSYQILEFYNKKTKIDGLPEPEPIP